MLQKSLFPGLYVVSFRYMKKPDDVTIVSITNNLNTIFGIGSDQVVYQWNTLDSSWHVFALKRDRDEKPAA
jgi:hypothetical protein